MLRRERECGVSDGGKCMKTGRVDEDRQPGGEGRVFKRCSWSKG